MRSARGETACKAGMPKVMNDKKPEAVSRRAFLGACLLASEAVVLSGCAHTLSGVNSREAEEAAAGARLLIRRPVHFRILQFTDLHFFGGKEPLRNLGNERTVNTLKQLTKLTRPDLVMVTGDLWPENREGKAEEHMRFAIEQLESLGVPWGYVWGNHDKLPDYTVGHRAFTEAKNSLYRGAQNNGNYSIDIVNRYGHRIWQLLCLNTGENGVDAAAREWLRELLAFDPKPSARLAFFHIPLKQYGDAWASGSAAGFKGEEVCQEQEDGSTLPLLKELGVRACFCGHDHVNDFSGMCDGVELVYGRATGAGSYGTSRFRKGGKLIVANGWTRQCTWRSITEDGKRWHPRRGERVDDSARRR